MILDSLIVRLAINGKHIRAQVAADIERLIHQLRIPYAGAKTSNAPIKNGRGYIQYSHPSIAMNFNLVQLSVEICNELTTAETRTLKRLINVVSTTTNEEITDETHFLLRSILLSMKQSGQPDMWSEILHLLLASTKENADISCDTMYFMLYLLAEETDGRKQMELLRGLTSFTAVKENIPLILNTYRSLSSSTSVALRILAVDLHTQLWLAENRTYQFLYNALIADGGKLSTAEKWEMNVVKANAIKRICSKK